MERSKPPVFVYPKLYERAIELGVIKREDKGWAPMPELPTWKPRP